MAIEIKSYTVGQVFTMTRFERISSLFDQMDTDLKKGVVHTFVKSPYTNAPYRTYEDHPFALRFDATAVNGLWMMRRGYRKQMDRMGLTTEANEIEAKIAHENREQELRKHIVRTGGE